jgi:hypothetical protein
MPDKIKHPAEHRDGPHARGGGSYWSTKFGVTKRVWRTPSKPSAAWGQKTQTVEARVATDLIDTGPACAVLTRKAACRFPS